MTQSIYRYSCDFTDVSLFQVENRSAWNYKSKIFNLNDIIITIEADAFIRQGEILPYRSDPWNRIIASLHR